MAVKLNEAKNLEAEAEAKARAMRPRLRLISEG